jgi:hypothetical protein
VCCVTSISFVELAGAHHSATIISTTRTSKDLILGA